VRSRTGAGSFTFNIDSLAMFKLKDPANAEGPGDLAGRDVAELPGVFNLNKGSIPVRLT
jgi:glucose/mannose transport system substrate-binding protein